jgi:MSHA biogenesis protein MshL
MVLFSLSAPARAQLAFLTKGTPFAPVVAQLQQLREGFGSALILVFMIGFFWGIIKIWSGANAIRKVGEDRPFFRLQQSTTFQSGGSTVPVNQTQESFSVSTITIGTILAVTPQIDGNGVITLDVLPAITRLQAIVTSPDGKQTAPLTEVKQASTIVRLKDGETAIIGGLISEEAGDSTRAVPVLGAVPVVGRAFRSKATLTNRTELVIFLTPKLIR